MSTGNKIRHSKTSISAKDKQAVMQVMKSGLVTSGNKSIEFEKRLCQYLNEEYLTLYSSGSSALYHIIKALNFKNNQEVLVPNYICTSVLKSIEVAGAKLVLYDNGADHWASVEENIKNKITRYTQAIIVNHTFGIFNSAIERISKMGITIIEDACHCLTKSSTQIPINKFSLASFYSFNATKLLATGEGGAVVTRQTSFYNKLLETKIDRPINDLSASFGISQLLQYNTFLKRRQEIACAYNEHFKEFDVTLNKRPSIYFRYPILLHTQKQEHFLKNKKVSFRKGVDNLLCFQMGIPENKFSNSLRDYRATISVPIYPSLSKKEIKTILEETKKELDV